MIRVAKPKTEENWEVVLEIQERSIPNIKLTRQAISRWQKHKDEVIWGYVSFKGLRQRDILSLLSAMKQGRAWLGKNASGYYTAYKLTLG